MDAYVWLPDNGNLTIGVFMCFDGHVQLITNCRLQITDFYDYSVNLLLWNL